MAIGNDEGNAKCWILILTIVGTGMSSVHSIPFNTYDSCEKARMCG
ncbi:hypothetical protein PHG25p026nc [Aeromonas phage 25]|uniref:Uncharacterized protein n=1 Tax=Aeromonas phage 25 TaxID=2911441 RepID=Q19CZ2_9CAUD|nr:hypothetical protein PHG25p026nc [Aeromonas phage 25]ABF72801.1 hypothetical protein PHG25p026nc [Aeromonas phage 25]